MSESQIQHNIFRELNGRRDTRIFRNNVGLGWVGKPVGEPGTTIALCHYRPIKFGLRVGSGDLIGWHSVTVTPDMVGQKIAVFTSIETKTPIGLADPDQQNWAEQIRIFGGIAGIARSVDESLALINPIPHIG